MNPSLCVFIGIVIVLMLWLAWHFWRDWAIGRDYRRITDVWMQSLDAYRREEFERWSDLRAEHERLAVEFKKRWGYGL